MGINSGNKVSVENVLQSGVGTANDGAPAATIIAQVDAGLRLRVTNINISIEVAAAGGGGVLSITDTDDTLIHKMDADAVKDVSLSFGALGFPLVAGKGLKVTLSGAVTTEATAHLSATGYLVHT